MKKAKWNKGNFKLFAILLFTCTFLALGTTAQAQEGFMAENLSLIDEVFLDTCSVEIYAEGWVDTKALMAGIEAGDDEETINQKFNANREKFYPEQEVVCIITNAANEFAASAYLSLYKSIYWWNNTNAYNHYWYWVASVNVATVSVNVLNGGYYVYQYVDTGWKYKDFITSGHTWCGYVTGNVTSKGFAGIGGYSSNKAHVVMYFFK